MLGGLRQVSGHVIVRFFSFVSWRYFGLGFGVGVPVAGESAAQREVTWDGSVESRFAQYIVKNSERAPFSWSGR